MLKWANKNILQFTSSKIFKNIQIKIYPYTQMYVDWCTFIRSIYIH